MKNVLLAIAITFVSISLSAQIMQKNMQMIHGAKPGYIQMHEGAKEGYVEDAFKSVFGEYGKLKYNRKGEIHEMQDVEIPSISSNAIDLYVKLTKSANGTESALFVDNGMAYITPEIDGEVSQTIESMLMEVNYEVQRAMVRDELKSEEKNLSNLEKDLDKLKKDNDKLHEEIEECEKKIQEAEEGIVVNLEDQDGKSEEIEGQKSLIEEVKERLDNIGKN